MKIMAIVDRNGLFPSVSTLAANHHEVRWVQLCYDFFMIEVKPDKLIGDRAYDSDPLNDDLRKDGDDRTVPIKSSKARYAKWTPTSTKCEALAGRAVFCRIQCQRRLPVR